VVFYLTHDGRFSHYDAFWTRIFQH